jgi:L-lactate permease
MRATSVVRFTIFGAAGFGTGAALAGALLGVVGLPLTGAVALVPCATRRVAWGSEGWGIGVSLSPAKSIVDYVQRCNSVLISLLGERER